MDLGGARRRPGDGARRRAQLGEARGAAFAADQLEVLIEALAAAAVPRGGARRASVPAAALHHHAGMIDFRSTLGAMKRAAVLLVFLLGCRFDLPDVGIDAPIDTSGEASADGPAVGCPADYAPLPGDATNPHRYRSAPNSLQWDEQRMFCAATSTKTYLAVPNDATELMGLVMVAGGTATFWVGIDDRAIESTYTLTSGGLAQYLPWATSEPNGGPEDCVTATGTTISDRKCDYSYLAVCECEP